MRISDWSSDVCSSDLRSELVEAALVAVDIDRARFRITPFPIETPKRLHEFVPPGPVCFTTLVNEWNDEKVRRLNEQGFPTETLGLSVPDNMRVTSGPEIPRQIGRNTGRARVWPTDEHRGAAVS